MSLEIVSRDLTALPTALLETAKAQMRITFTDDDVAIKRYVAASIDYFEAFTGLTIVDTEATWTPDEYDDWVGQRVLCPIQPIREWGADDADGLDVTASYRLTGTSTGAGRAAGIYLVSKTTGSETPPPIATGLTLTIVAGYEDWQKIPPSQVDLILRSAARLYEDRESTTDVSLDAVPDWFLEMLAGNWVPRV